MQTKMIYAAETEDTDHRSEQMTQQSYNILTLDFENINAAPPPTGSTDRPKGLELKFCIFVIFTVSQPLLVLFIKIVFEIVFI